METLEPRVAKQIAQAARAFQHRVTGREPHSVGVLLSGETLLITLHGALSPAEMAMALSPEGAAQVQEFHRYLFANSADELRQEIEQIIGVPVCEAIGEVAMTAGSVAKVFKTGTTVQVFLLADGVPRDSCEERIKWSVLKREFHDVGPVEEKQGICRHRRNRGLYRLCKVTVLDIRGNNVKLGFELDAEVPVHRTEVWERIRAGIPGKAEATQK